MAESIPAKLDANVFRSRVGRRTVLLFLCCAILPVSALAVLSFGQVTAQLEKQSEKNLRQASKSAGMSIYERVGFLENALRVAASRAASGSVAIQRFDARLTDKFRAVVIEELPALVEAERRHLRSGRTRLGIDRPPGVPARVFLRRALDPDRLEAGVLVGEIDTTYLLGNGEHVLAASGEVCVLDESDAVVFCSFEPPAAMTAALKRAGARAAPGQFDWTDAGRHHLAAYWPLFLKAEFLAPTWTVVLTESKADVLAPLAKFRRMFPLILVLSLATVLILSIGQIRRNLLPLQKLQQGARRISTGDFVSRVEVTSDDEFADVAASFNAMAARLGMQFGVLTTLNAINGALNRGDSLDEVLERCAEALHHHLGLSGVAIWVLGSDQEVLELRATAGTSGPAEGRETRISVTGGGLGLIVQHGRPHVGNGAVDDQRVPDREWARREGMAGFVGQPLITDGKAVGAIAAFARHPIDEIILGGVASAAGEIAGAIERSRVAEALKESAEQVRQLQKMEAVGSLAGGIAHDFNNLLTVITGTAQLLLLKLPAEDPLRARVTLIDATAARAASLTRQLLAFSRKQVLAPSVIDLNETVKGSTAMLKRLIGEHIELEFRPAADLGRIKADGGQLEQVIMNLVVNARDAMTDGGSITLETANVALNDAPVVRRLGVPPGAYVMLSVRDVGIGMDADTQARIFEPFFTTKEVGKGTGLGLATVYGIVKQSGGAIGVESAPKQGTTFKVYLPRVEDTAVRAEATDDDVAGGNETILLVEDESDVLHLVAEMLQGLGYRVLTAGKVDEACVAAERHPGAIDLLITDVVMPGMSGFALAERLLTVRPHMKVLYMSGYTEHPAVGRHAEILETSCVQKPFRPAALGRKVREVLDPKA